MTLAMREYGALTDTLIAETLQRGVKIYFMRADRKDICRTVDGVKRSTNSSGMSGSETARR
jgi:hypothetical protein